MKFSRLLLLLALVGLTATAAMADGIDPTVVIRQVDPPPVPITNPYNGTIVISATADQNVFAVQNQTGVTLVSLTLTLIGLNANLDFNFGENPGDGIFTTFLRTVNDITGSTTLAFFGTDDSHSGLLPAECSTPFSELSFGCQKCIGGIYSIEFDGIPPGAVVVGTATVSAPEPATLLLLSAGFVGIAALRKRRAILQN